LTHPTPHAFDLYLDALLGKDTAPLVTVGEAADRVAVMEAMYQAANRGWWLTPTGTAQSNPARDPTECSETYYRIKLTVTILSNWYFAEALGGRAVAEAGNPGCGHRGSPS